MSASAILLMEGIVDFIITGGAALTGYMTANGGLVMPTRAGILLTLVAGLVGAANQIRGRMKELPKP